MDDKTFAYIYSDKDDRSEFGYRPYESHIAKLESWAESMLARDKNENPRRYDAYTARQADIVESRAGSVIFPGNVGYLYYAPTESIRLEYESNIESLIAHFESAGFEDDRDFWVESGELAVRLFHDGMLSPFARIVEDAMLELDRYPVFNEDDLSKREFESWSEFITEIIEDRLSDLDLEDTIPVNDVIRTFDEQVNDGAGLSYWGELYIKEEEIERAFENMGLVPVGDGESRCGVCHKIVPDESGICAECERQRQIDAGQLELDI